MEFLLTVCMAAIASALFRILVPENKFTKQISLLIACVFLLAGINAITGAELNFDTSSFDNAISKSYISFSGDVNRSLQKDICQKMSNKLYTLLNENQIYPQQIHVNVNISGLYSISITQVKLVLPETQRDKADKAYRLVSEELTEDIELKVVIKE